MIVVKGHLEVIKIKSISIRLSLGFDLWFCLVVSNYLFWVHGFRLLVKWPIYKYSLIVIIVSSFFWISWTLLCLSLLGCCDLLITPYQCDCKALFEGEVHIFYTFFLILLPFGKTIRKVVSCINKEKKIQHRGKYINCFRALSS